MPLTWSQMAYYIIVCVTTTHFEPDQVFFVLYLCISYVLFVYIFTRLFNDFISMNFLIAVFFPVSPFIPMSPLLTWEIFANLSIHCNLPIYYFGQNLPASPFIPPSPSFFFFNWDSLHASLNSHYKAWSYNKRSTKRLQDTENLLRKNLQLKYVC